VRANIVIFDAGNRSAPDARESAANRATTNETADPNRLRATRVETVADTAQSDPKPELRAALPVEGGGGEGGAIEIALANAIAEATRAGQ
jgi:hypothetical protein